MGIHVTKILVAVPVLLLMPEPLYLRHGGKTRLYDDGSLSKSEYERTSPPIESLERGSCASRYSNFFLLAGGLRLCRGALGRGVNLFCACLPLVIGFH